MVLFPHTKRKKMNDEDSLITRDEKIAKKLAESLRTKEAEIFITAYLLACDNKEKEFIERFPKNISSFKEDDKEANEEANKYAMSVHKTEDHIWSGYRDFLRGVEFQKNRKKK